MCPHSSPLAFRQGHVTGFGPEVGKALKSRCEFSSYLQEAWMLKAEMLSHRSEEIGPAPSERQAAGELLDLQLSLHEKKEMLNAKPLIFCVCLILKHKLILSCLLNN